MAQWQRRSIPGHLFELTDQDGNIVMRIRGGMMPALADANLMTAAPALADALRRIVEWVDSGCDPSTASIEQARAVLARL